VQLRHFSHFVFRSRTANSPYSVIASIAQVAALQFDFVYTGNDDSRYCSNNRGANESAL